MKHREVRFMRGADPYICATCGNLGVLSKEKIADHDASPGHIAGVHRIRSGDPLHKLAMNIVNQILDTAETPVEKRQAINDRCDEFVFQCLATVRPTKTA